MATLNPLIPLSVNAATPVTAFQQAQTRSAQNELLQAQTAGVQARTVGAIDERTAAKTEKAQRKELVSKFRNIVGGVNKISPRLDEAIASGDSAPLLDALAARREELLADPSVRDTDDTDLAISIAKSGNLGELRRLFDGVLAQGQELDRMALGLPSERRGEVGDPAALRTFEALVEKGQLNTEEKMSAARRALGLEARAGTRTGEERIAVDPELAQSVADSKANIGSATKFAELTAKSRAEFIDKGFITITQIDKNMLNLGRAIEALEAGATTGEIEQLFPSFTEATILLEQVQGELALDVVGSVTFGALSKGELDLAREIALPTGLERPELLRFLQAKQAAQTKLRQYYSEQIQFLEKPGGSIAGFLRLKERQAGGGGGGVAGQPGAGGGATDMSDEEIARQLGL